MRNIIRFLITLGLTALSLSTEAFYSRDAGKPASGPLPTYCQMGSCYIQTVEAIDPVVFDSRGVIFRVEGQSWLAKDMKNFSRDADITNYVLCSKSSPATLDETDGGRFQVTFLSPEDEGTYSHANELQLAEFFVVCHSRAFKTSLSEEGPLFAKSIGYHSQHRDDQPTINSLADVWALVR